MTVFYNLVIGFLIGIISSILVAYAVLVRVANDMSQWSAFMRSFVGAMPKDRDYRVAFVIGKDKHVCVATDGEGDPDPGWAKARDLIDEISKE